MKTTPNILGVAVVLFAVATASQFNGGAGHQTYILASLLVLGAFSYFLINHDKPLTSPGVTAPLAWLAAFVAWATLSLAWSEALGSTAIAQPRLYAGLLLGLSAYMVSAREFRISLGGLLLLAVALSLYTAYQGLYLGIHRPAAFFVNWNTHAAFLNMLLLPGAAYYLTGRHKKLLGVLLATIAFASAMTLSRGAILGGAAGLLCLALLGRSHVTRSAFAGLLLWIVGGYLVGSLLYEGAPLARLSGSLAGENIASGRWFIWESSWEMAKQYPLLGWGMGTFWQAYPAFRHPHDGSAGQNAHNDYLQFLVELGPLGLILFIGLLGALAYRIYRRRHSIGLEGAGLAAALTALAVQATFTTTYYQLAIWLVFGWYLGRLSLLTATEPRTEWSPTAWFTRKGFATVILLAAAIPGTWLAALFMSEVELDKLQQAGNAGEFLRQLPQAEKYYNLRDVTQLLFAGQIRRALVEKQDEISTQERDQAIETALDRLAQAEQLNPMRTDNFLFRAQLKQLAPERYPESEVIADFQRVLALDPYALPARLTFARYLENIGMDDRSRQVLEQGWDRHYYGPYQTVTAFIEALKEAKTKTGDTAGMEAILEQEERLKSKRAKGYLITNWYLGDTLRGR